MPKQILLMNNCEHGVLNLAQTKITKTAAITNEI